MVEVTTFFKESLPRGFKVYEDPHFIFLYYYGEKLELVAVFPITAGPEKIKEEVFRFSKQKLRVEAFCSKS
jgi:hypothetical protein